jgi:hypothetical protein
MYWFGVASLIFVVPKSWSFTGLWNFPLLLKLMEMLDLILAEFHELFVELRHYFGLLPDKMAVQRPCPQGFDSLSDDLIVWYFRSLSLML